MSDQAGTAHTATVHKYSPEKTIAAAAHHGLGLDDALTPQHFEAAGIQPDETLTVHHELGHVVRSRPGQPDETFTLEQWAARNA